LRAFDTAQQQHLALVFVNLSTETFHLYLIFFGLWCVLTGYLIFRSTFLPGILVGQLSGQGGYPFVNALKSDQRGAGASAGRPLRNGRRTCLRRRSRAPPWAICVAASRMICASFAECPTLQPPCAPRAGDRPSRISAGKGYARRPRTALRHPSPGCRA